MYVKAYLDLCSSLDVVLFASWPVYLGGWPGGSWLPWRTVPWLCFLLVFGETSVGRVLSYVSLFHLHNGHRPN